MNATLQKIQYYAAATKKSPSAKRREAKNSGCERLEANENLRIHARQVNHYFLFFRAGATHLRFEAQTDFAFDGLTGNLIRDANGEAIIARALPKQLEAVKKFFRAPRAGGFK